MSDSTVSVIVPCHNADPYLVCAVESVLRQTYTDIELIVVDDGSTDDTVAVAQRFGDRIRLVRQSNRGAASARNAGLRESRGAYIAFLDADDWWHPEKLKISIEHLQSCRSCEAVFASWIECRTPSDANWLAATSAPLAHAATSLDTIVAEDLYRSLLLDSVIHTSSIVLKRGVVTATGDFDEELIRGQDLDYWLRISRLSTIHKLSPVLSAYRIHHGSATTRPTSTNYRALIIENALRRWGMTDPHGRRVGSDDIRRVLQRSWREFGDLHLKFGSPAISLESYHRAQAYGDSSWTIMRSKIRALIKFWLSQSDAQLDSRHKLSAFQFTPDSDSDQTRFVR